MANLIVSVFVIALIMVAVLLLSWASLSSADQVLIEWDRMVGRGVERERTEVSLVSADLFPTSTNVEISIRNVGQTVLADFPRWDVVVQYYASSTNQNLKVSWFPYTTTTSPSSGKWTVRGVYMNAGTLQPEVYGPKLLDPGEEMILRLNITPAIPTDTDNLVTIGTPNGITVAAQFSR